MKLPVIYREHCYELFTKTIVRKLSCETALEKWKDYLTTREHGEIAYILGVSSLLRIQNAELAHFIAATASIDVRVGNKCMLELPLYLTTNYVPFEVAKPIKVESGQRFGYRFNFHSAGTLSWLNDFMRLKIIETSLHLVVERTQA